MWDRFNKPSRFATPQTTIDAILHAVKARRLGALQEPETIERLKGCDAAAKRQIDARIDAMLMQGKTA
jgi:hypothetical protein